MEMIQIYYIRSFKISDLGFDREKSKVKVKVFTLTNNPSSVKSKNQKMSEDYENCIFENKRENIIY